MAEVSEQVLDARPRRAAQRANLRPLTAITADIYKSGRQNIFTVGKLLLEAKEQMKHGQWLPYLKSIEWGARNAQLYMAVAELAAKYESISHLNVAPGALFELTSWADREEDAAKWEEEAKREEASADTPEARKEAEEDRKIAEAARKEAEEDTLLAIERLRASMARGDNVAQQRVAISLTRMAKINPPETTELALKAASDAINQNCFGDTKRYAAMMAQGEAIIKANPKTDEELKAVCAANPIPFGSYANQDDIPADAKGRAMMDVIMDSADDEEDEVEDDEAEEGTASAPATDLLPRQRALVSKFNDACEELLELVSRPSAAFLDSDVSAADLDMLGNFLKQIAASKKAALKTNETADDDLTIPECLRRGAA